MLASIINLLNRKYINNFVYVVVQLLRMKALGELVEFSQSLPKFAHLLTAFGRVFAIAVHNSVNPPEGHEKAILIHQEKILGLTFTFWLTSFPKEQWRNLPPERLLKL
jgi:hypothetical protein